MSLKELTKEVHKQAERQDFVHELMSGKMSDEMYAKFPWNPTRNIQFVRSLCNGKQSIQ